MCVVGGDWKAALVFAQLNFNGWSESALWSWLMTDAFQKAAERTAPGCSRCGTNAAVSCLHIVGLHIVGVQEEALRTWCSRCSCCVFIKRWRTMKLFWFSQQSSYKHSSGKSLSHSESSVRVFGGASSYWRGITGKTEVVLKEKIKKIIAWAPPAHSRGRQPWKRLARVPSPALHVPSCITPAPSVIPSVPNNFWLLLLPLSAFGSSKRS